jgi:hypothetical protein
VYKLAHAISDVARVRRGLRRSQARRWDERRRGFIREHVQGRSFADIGGMFGINGEIAFQAEAAGATQVTLFDSGEPTPQFLERHKTQGSSIRTVQGDLEDPQSMREVGPHDVVWCNGVIYHTPNPFLQLVHLHEITKELLFVGSATIPEIPGVPQACVYYPYLERDDRAPYARGMLKPEGALGVGTEFDERPMYGHGNFWWGITPSAFRAMLRSARFEVIDEYPSSEWPWGTAFAARPLAEHPSLPPTDYYRTRGVKLHEGRTPPFDGYYDKGPDAVATNEDAFPRMDGLPALDISPRWWRRAMNKLGDRKKAS